MERSTVTRTTRSVASRIFEEIGVTPQAGNRFHEVAERLLAASEMVGLRHHQQIIHPQAIGRERLGGVGGKHQVSAGIAVGAPELPPQATLT